VSVRVVLVGFMGSGKSTLAPLVAQALGRDWHDTDRLVERREGRSVARVIAESGEESFRRIEREVLEDLLARGNGVVAAGGGILERHAVRRRLNREAATVWLDVPLEECRRRLGTAPDRPLWPAQDPLALRALYERRRAAYALARVRVAAGREPPETTARRVLRRLRAVFP
jgi:shikimate kinase